MISESSVYIYFSCSSRVGFPPVHVTHVNHAEYIDLRTNVTRYTIQPVPTSFVGGETWPHTDERPRA